MSIDENELDEMVDAFTEALYALTGRRFDDRGNRMSPTHANKRGVRYRYYVSHAILQNRKTEAGSVARIPAPRDRDSRVRRRPQASCSNGWNGSPGKGQGAFDRHTRSRPCWSVR